MIETTSSSSDLRIHRAMVQAAITAPSPDNNQPWKFRSRGDCLEAFLDTSRSLPSDVMSMFDMTAIGAAVENAVIAAAQSGQSADVHWRGLGQDDQRPVVELALHPGAEPDPLYLALPERCTSRKAYLSTPLESELRRELSAVLERFPHVRVDWLTESNEKARFGSLVAQTDALRFKTRPFHEELFHQLRFQPDEVETTRDGLDVRTLELPPGVTTLLRMLRSWKMMQAVHTLRLTPLLTHSSKVAAQRSGAIAIVSVPEASTEQFFTGGRAIQRLWLAATLRNLSMHPLGSLPIFLLKPDAPKEFRTVIENARREIKTLLPELEQRVIQLAFRVGHGDRPTQRTLRRPMDCE